MENFEHNLIFDFRNLRSGIGTSKLFQKIYVVYEDIAYECIVVPKSLNMEQNSNDYICGAISPARTISDLSCCFYVEHYRMIDVKDVPFDGIIINQQVIEKEKIVKEYFNIYQFIS